MPELEGNSPHGHVYSEAGVKSRTKQSDALNTDVNSIVARHIAHRIPLPDGGAHYKYGDFSTGASYHDLASRLREIEGSFEKLPAHIRKHCHNDPGQFLDIVYDPQRRGELEELGLVSAQAPQDAPDAAKPVEADVADGPTS